MTENGQIVVCFRKRRSEDVNLQLLKSLILFEFRLVLGVKKF